MKHIQKNTSTSEYTGDVENTLQTIYDCDFEDGQAGPFTGRGCEMTIVDGGADGTSKSLLAAGRTEDWNGVQIDISRSVVTDSRYEISFYVRQTTGEQQKVDVSLQYRDRTGEEHYDSLYTAVIPSDEWTKVEFTSRKIPEHVGDIILYWQTEYLSNNFMDFGIDKFIMKGLAKPEGEDEGYPDLSMGLKRNGAGNNPALTVRLTADPWAMEYNGRVYVYGTNDSEQYEKMPEENNNYTKIDTLNCYSTSDMVNWTDHGMIQVGGSEGAAKWADNSWAPAAAYKKIDGKDRFFLYFANSANNIGVLTADSPTGPWTDPIGKPLIDRDTPGCGVEEVPWLFDPAVLVDDDGTGYIYFGGIGSTSAATEEGIAHLKNPRCARVAKLGADMVSIDGVAQVIDAPYMFEDSGINKINGKYYYSYCTNWDSFPGREMPIANIAVMVSDNPMGEFRYVGTVLKNPGHYFGAYGNNHHCFMEYGGTYYAFYHTKRDTLALGTKGDFRTTYVDFLNLGENGDFTESDGSAADTKMTVKGVEPVSL